MDVKVGLAVFQQARVVLGLLAEILVTGGLVDQPKLSAEETFTPVRPRLAAVPPTSRSACTSGKWSGCASNRLRSCTAAKSTVLSHLESRLSRSIIGFGSPRSVFSSRCPAICGQQLRRPRAPLITFQRTVLSQTVATTQPQLIRNPERGERSCLLSPHSSILSLCIMAVGAFGPPLCRGCAPATPPPKPSLTHRFAVFPALRLNQRGGSQPHTQSDSLNGGKDEGLVYTLSLHMGGRAFGPPLCRGSAPATPPPKTIAHPPFGVFPALRLNQHGGCQPNTQSDSLNGGSDEGLVYTLSLHMGGRAFGPPLCRGCAPATPPSKTIAHPPFRRIPSGAAQPAWRLPTEYAIR